MNPTIHLLSANQFYDISFDLKSRINFKNLDIRWCLLYYNFTVNHYVCYFMMLKQTRWLNILCMFSQIHSKLEKYDWIVFTVVMRPATHTFFYVK